MSKFEKRVVCEYCEEKMESTNRNKRFCSDKCRVYWNRENLKNKIEPPPRETPKPENKIKEEKETFSSFGDYRRKKLGL